MYNQSQFRLSAVRGIIKHMRVSIALLAVVALMAVVVMPLQIALGQPSANPIRALPEKAYTGKTFNVIVNFTAPADNFTLISLIDLAPAGWNVAVNATWCTPAATVVVATGNQTEIVWGKTFKNGTPFKALYKVTVPNDAELGNYSFSGSLGYYCASPWCPPSEHIFEDVAGDYLIKVVLGPTIAFSPLNLSFSAVAGDPNPPDKPLEIWNLGEGTINWTLSDDDCLWLSEIPMIGNSTGEHDNVTVAADITGMSPGDYSANITISDPEASNSPQFVPVILHISVPPRWISFSPPSFNFSAVEGSSNLENKTLKIWNLGGGMLNWTLSDDDCLWLSESPMSGNSTGPSDNTSVAVSVNITGMTVGNYTANITINGTGAVNNPQMVPVILHISEPPPWISFSPPSLSFSATLGGANPKNKALEIWNSRGGTLNWSLTDDATWLSEMPENGTSSGEHNTVTVSVNITGMSVGHHSANITINASEASNSPRVVPVGLHIQSSGGGGGGPGGGGGGSYYLEIDILGKITRVKMSYGTSETLEAAVAPDFNNTYFVEIDADTRVICDDTNKAPEVLMLRVANQSPPVPDGSVIVGSVYNFTGNYGYQRLKCCSGVSFDQNITIVLSYDPNDLPESTASVAVAYYDVEQDSWVGLPTEIGRVAEVGKATGLINHCSAVAVIAELAPAPAPASFVPSALSIEQSPRVWKNIFVGVTGEDVTITANVVNNGGQEDTYTAELKLNGETMDAKEVTLAAGQSQQVTFTLSGMDYGQYEVEVAGLSGEFTVSRIIDWGSIFGIILAVAVITWAAIWWMRRKKPAQPAESEVTEGTEE